MDEERGLTSRRKDRKVPTISAVKQTESLPPITTLMALEEKPAHLTRRDVQVALDLGRSVDRFSVGKQDWSCDVYLGHVCR